MYTQTRTSLLLAALAALFGVTLALVAPLLVSAHNDQEKKLNAAKTVQIAENGTVLVRGAEVTASSDETITAKTTWGDTAIVWTLRTDGDTDFVKRSGSESSRNDISLGDEVSFKGSIAGSGGAFAVDVDTVKNWSEEDDVKAVYSKTLDFWKKIGERFESSLKFGHKDDK